MRTPKRKLFAFLAVVAFLLFLGLNSGTITNSFRNNASDAVSAPLGALHRIKRWAQDMMPASSLRKENARLSSEIEDLKRRLAEKEFIHSENERLKEILDFKKSIPFSTIPAEVIGRDPTNWSNSLIIDKGATNGIRQNMAVLSTSGLVGRVLEVGWHSSKILLITDPNSRVGVVIQRNRQGGMLVGRSDGKCKMIYISLDSDAALGDRVVTAGLGSIFGRGILVGRIIKVGKEPGRLYKYAIVQPAQDMSKAEEVLCVK